MFQNKKKIIIGCVHLLPMPNTPFYETGDYKRSIEKAIADAVALKEGGASGCLIQTVDRVYTNEDDADYVRVSCLSVIGREVRCAVGTEFLIGVQVMWNCITPSLAVAYACGADFTRCSCLVGQANSPYGQLAGNPMKVMQYRKAIGARHVTMIAEVAGYHNGEGAVSEGFEAIIEYAGKALTVGADAIEVFHKDEDMNQNMVLALKEAYPSVPVVLGGGTNVENAATRLRYADGAIVGSCFENGKWGGSVDKQTVQAYMENVSAMEGNEQAYPFCDRNKKTGPGLFY